MGCSALADDDEMGWGEQGGKYTPKENHKMYVRPSQSIDRATTAAEEALENEFPVAYIIITLNKKDDWSFCKVILQRQIGRLKM